MPEKIPRGVILDLLDLYDLNIQIVYAFFENKQNIPPKLNSYSIEVTKEMYSIAAKWHIEFEGSSHSKEEDESRIPFHYDGDLITEAMYRNQGPSFDWDGLSPNWTMQGMHEAHRLIKDLLRSERVNANEVERDDAVQDIVTGTKRALAELETKRNSAPQLEHITKMEIIAMPEMKMRNVEDSGISKGKTRVYPPHFPSTAWPDVTIQFINDHDVFITAGAKSAQSDYRALGFEDAKRDTPNRAWQFLLGLARNEGATLVLATPIPDNTKQLKKQLSDGLIKIFDNATDPFHNPAGTHDHTYRIKLNLIPPEAKHPEMVTEEYGTEESDPEEEEDGR